MDGLESEDSYGKVKRKKVMNGQVVEEESEEDEDEEEKEDDSESAGDESDDDEGLSDDSVVYVDDEESEGEAHLGEDREATVLQYTKGDAIPFVPDFDKFPFTDEDSSVTATRAFAWMVAPCDVQTFFKDFFQSNALIAKRSSPNYYSNLFSTQRLVELMEKNYLEYGTNINIAEYKNGVRRTMNGTGRVYPNHLKEHIALGRSAQFVNPQTFDDRVWYFCEVLQEMFGCFVGANTYLTPAGSAGFAPHWDEIDAFLLQLEGKKYWKVYAPDSSDDELPLEPSGNFTDDDMKDRKPTFEGWIEAGDLLYIPRGFIHQVPEAVKGLANNRWKVRKSLPVGMLDMGGVAGIEYRMEEHFEEKWKSVLDRHMTVLRNSLREVCDGGIDLMAREFMRTALPPLLTENEKALSAVGSNADILHGKPLEFRPSTKVKLIRRHAQRLIFESDDSCYIVHRMANSRLYEGRPEQNFEIPLEFVSGFNALCDSYPEWMSLSEMPDDINGEEVQALCHLLYYHGLIVVQQLPDRIKIKKKKGKKGKQ
ncbi:cupin family protein [Ancylostoma duodenale]|uniref:Bifunctional lysine-specific demethylase and histidyl-hydroxylase n=1 Tax=Ancylostoma duodenale TaxID=51022 RepID=A0A0C2GP64_9BILA|nr:cupin family protein [Ancylostoma duodenale]